MIGWTTRIFVVVNCLFVRVATVFVIGPPYWYVIPPHISDQYLSVLLHSHTSWSSCKIDFRSIGVFVKVWTYLDSILYSIIPESTAHMQTLEFFVSELVSSRNVMSSKSRHLRKCLDTNLFTRVPKICTRVILAVNIPRGITKRSISSPSPNSLSTKKYDVTNIRNT